MQVRGSGLPLGLQPPGPPAGPSAMDCPVYYRDNIHGHRVGRRESRTPRALIDGTPLNGYHNYKQSGL